MNDELVLEETEASELDTIQAERFDAPDVQESGSAADLAPTDTPESLDEQPDPDTSASQLSQLRSGAQQGEFPFALIQGEAVTELPQDLYIPPDALEVFLEAFEGPLDLLLYLIKKQNIDILEINVAEITAQYMQYVNMMDAIQFELASEYLLMAAMLAEIKSRILLPRSEELEEDEDDPRAQLIRRLQEYERFKQAAEDIEEMPRMGREIYQAIAEAPEFERTQPLPTVDIKDMLIALSDVLHRAEMFEHHHIQREKLSTRERMSQVLATLSTDSFTSFVSLFSAEEGRLGVVVTFLAIMELIKESLVELVQNEPFGPIHVKAKSS